MLDSEYLVNFGRSGDFGRFRAASAFERGDRVVVRTGDAVEAGTILCPVSEGHARFLGHSLLGEILRPLGPDDERNLETLQERGQQLFEHARRLVAELDLPLEVVDVELSLEGKHAVVHHLRRVDCDYRPLVSTLARTFDVLVTMQNLVLPAEPEEEAHAGCGKPDCGQGESGCSSCGTGGGCSSCSQGAKKEDVGAYLARMAQTPARPRVPLL